MPDQFVTTISFNLAQDGSPQWTATPEIEDIPWGTVATLVWQLQPGAGAPSAQFPPTGGIVFAPNATYPTPWPNAQPVAVPVPSGQPILQYTASDPNVTPHPQPIVYKYNVTVTCNGQSYQFDPEEQNDGGG